MAHIHVINGPNLNLLGTREPEQYGSTTLSDIEQMLASLAAAGGHMLTFKQSNIEGELIGFVQEAGASDGVILNAAAYTHTSVGLRDAVAAIKPPVIEVHLSNIYAREAFRHHSLIAPVSKGMITGLGASGYRLAFEAILDILAH